jgi:hypothetical protein
MKETLSQRAKRILSYLAIAIFLAGGCISLVSMEVNPVKWPGVCRPLFVLITFLFFQWFYSGSDKESEEIHELENKIKQLKERDDSVKVKGSEKE